MSSSSTRIGLALCALSALPGVCAAAPAAGAAAVPTITVTARRLNAARSQIQTQTGASTYTIDQDAIAATPGGANVQLDQVLLQAPGVVQDSFGQIHVRGDHNDLQYRLNGLILPEGISVFSQTLSPRLISSASLITGALPAEYGLRTAGIVDLTTRGGLLQPGGTVSLYGGSHGTIEPSVEYGGSSGALSYFVTGDLLRNELGIESPDGSANPVHDHSTQAHAFGYFEDILDPSNRLSLILGLSNDHFQIPNPRGLQPGLGLTVNGRTGFPSEDLDENQYERTQYAIFGWQHAAGALNWQSSVSARYSSLDFEPDWTGGLLYDGIAQNAVKHDAAVAWQTDAAYDLSDTHTLRAGLYLQHDHSTSATLSQVLPVDAAGVQTGDVPVMLADDGSQSQWIESLYLQDEWQPLATVTINFGLRFDAYHAYSHGSALSPRVNLVWQALPGTTVHAGYARYFTPPPFELIGARAFSMYEGTTALPPGSVTEDSPPVAERSNYYDAGVQQRLLDGSLTLGVDGYYEAAEHLLDEGQFGAPIILTPFNYRHGHLAGVAFTANYAIRSFSAYANLAYGADRGRGIESSQFNFDADDLAYVADHYIHLDHEERISASGGVSYLWRQTRFSLDLLFGTGLRADLTLPDGSSIPNGDHTPSYTQVNLGVTHTFHIAGAGALAVRLDVVNLFDKVYQIRSGSGIGVFASQYAPRRGVFVGVSKPF